MVNYKNAKIYKICPINGEDECYIGSTTQGLSSRMTLHRYEFINKLTGPNSKILFNKYGSENCKIVLIKKFPCTSKEELHAEEAKHIKNNNCVNKNIPGRTYKQYYQDNKEQHAKYFKQYRQDNKEQIAEYKKEYQQDNKEQIAEYKKQYYQDNKKQIIEKNKQYKQDNKEKFAEYQKHYTQDNKEQIAEYQKQYRQDNKEQHAKYFKQYRQDNKEQYAEKSKIKYHCICGSMPAINHKARHERTAKHIKGEQAFYDGCDQALLELNNNK
jgi:hypothetical protein